MNALLQVFIFTEQTFHMTFPSIFLFRALHICNFFVEGGLLARFDDSSEIVARECHSFLQGFRNMIFLFFDDWFFGLFGVNGMDARKIKSSIFLGFIRSLGMIAFSLETSSGLSGCYF